jgi:ribosomal protein S18 acetylase RimI-like enzyme
MNYKLAPASEFSEDEKELFKNFVADKGQVYMKSLNKLIDNSILLFIPDTINIDAVGALKIPTKKHKEKVFGKSKSGLDPKDFKFELGWIVSLKERQGLGKKVVEFLLNCQPKNYATVREDNDAMIHILEKYGFKKYGDPYKSERGDYKIVLYVKE